jgi:hypothetical protein
LRGKATLAWVFDVNDAEWRYEDASKIAIQIRCENLEEPPGSTLERAVKDRRGILWRNNGQFDPDEIELPLIPIDVSAVALA